MQNPDVQLFTDTVYNEAAFALKNAGFSKQEIKERVEKALLCVGLDDFDDFPHALTRADRTKVVLACVLAMGCKIIIFDEIDVGQDYRGSRQIMNIAKELHLQGYTVIFVTHNMSLVCEYAKRLVIMDRKGILVDKDIR
jgi:energy-coupling factor transport system ATP-binding protein